MSKNEMRRYIILAVVFVVFSVIAFAAPFTRNTVFWTAYAFGVAAIAFQIFAFKSAFDTGRSIKSKFYGFPVARVGFIYLIVQLLLSIVLMVLAERTKTWIAIILNILPIAFAVIGTIATDTAREEVERQEAQVKRTVSTMRSLQAASTSLVGLAKDDVSKRTVEKLAEEFRFSDPVSNGSTEEIETKLSQLLEELKSNLKSGNIEKVSDLCSVVSSLLTERNKLCALNK